jgi:transcriptional regulator with XRE-family HTH domain
LRKSGLSESEFARKTGIKQQVCNQIFRGQTSNPRIETLVKFAQFFQVTVGQLVGTEPLEEIARRSASSLIPLLNWNDIVPWVNEEKLPSESRHSIPWISCDLKPGLGAYAIKSSPNFEPFFDRHSIMIIDPSEEERLGHFVVVSLDDKTISVRRLVEDLGVRFLNPIAPGIPAVRLERKYRLLGTVIEVRMSINSNPI